MTNKKAVILLSGGLDSATSAAMAIDEGYELYAISFSYGQKHQIELESVKKIIKFFNIKHHKIVTLDASIFSNSALITHNNKSVPKNREIDPDDIPVTYVPARNILFLSYALAFAESYNIDQIYIGANILDYSGYPDCRPEFLKDFEKMANSGTKLGQNRKIDIKAPLLNLNKAQIIKKGLDLGFDYSITHSCYDPDQNGKSCGACDSCILRLKGFAENNINDPIEYI